MSLPDQAVIDYLPDAAREARVCSGDKDFEPEAD